MRPRPTRLFPPAYFAIAFGLILLLDRFAPGPHWLPTALRWIGWIPVALGLMLFVFTVAGFRRSGTPLRPFKGVGTLMTGGTFRFSRNPIYLGMTLLLLGTSLWRGTASPLWVPFAFAAIIQKRFVEAEEEFLTEHFGDAYRAYRLRVRRWL